MNRIVSFILGLAMAVLATTNDAQAQATRTWVSGVGDDANPCSRTAPCKTFAGAISKTAAGGEISVLDPGGYGAVTITKSISIAAIGDMGSILAAGTNGIIINVAVTDRVVLQGLELEGAGTGLNGVRIVGGGNIVLNDVIIRNFRAGTGFGIDIQSMLGAKLLLNDVIIINNLGGVNVLSTTGQGSNAVIITDSVIDKNTSFGVRADNALSIVSMNKSLIAGTNPVLISLNGGVFQSYGNNVLRTGTPTVNLPLQ